MLTVYNMSAGACKGGGNLSVNANIGASINKNK